MSRNGGLEEPGAAQDAGAWEPTGLLFDYRVSSTIVPVIRLRQSLEAALRHPLLGPLVLLLLALVLGFLALHTIEHGVEGFLFSCALAVAIGFRLLIVPGRTWRVRPGRPSLCGRAPPTRAFRLLPPMVLGGERFAVPLRL